LTSDQIVLEIVSGYKIPFTVKPSQTLIPSNPKCTDAELEFLKLEISRLQLIGAVSRSNYEKDQFISNIFTVPKPNGNRRFILNLKKLNQFIYCPHFKMEDYRSVCNLIRENMFLATVDLQDAYFHIPINAQFQKYLKFYFQDTLYQFNCVPFGLCTAPLIFTKILKPVFEKLRSLGFPSVRYLDDFLLLGYDKMHCEESIAITLKRLESLGFTINYQKSSLYPSTSQRFLGFIFDSESMNVCLPEEKIKRVSESISRFLSSIKIKIQQASELQGLLISVCPGVEYAMLYTRSLAIDIQKSLDKFAEDYSAPFSYSDETKDDLGWWLTHISNATRKIRQDVYEHTIFSDASKTGWGCHHNNVESPGWWSSTQKHLHINVLESLAVEMALQIFAKKWSNTQILLRVDNDTAISYINRYGGCHNEDLLRIAKRIWKFCEERQLFIFASYIKSKDNFKADANSRAQIDESEWILRSDCFQRIVNSFGSPQIDLFASHLSNKCPRFCSWHPDPKSEAVDAFTVDWNFDLGYAFPPFCVIPRVLKKLRISQCKCIVVVPDWPSQSWYPEFMRLSRSNWLKFEPCKSLLTSPYFCSPHPMASSLRLVAAVLSPHSI